MIRMERSMKRSGRRCPGARPRRRARTLALHGLIAVAMAPAPLAPAAAEAPPPAPSIQSSPIVVGRSFALRSAILGDVRQVNVWVPPDYAPKDRPYDVVYLLDGALSQDFEHIAGLAQLGALGWTFRPPIIVGIETKDRQFELTSPARDARYRRGFPRNGGAARFLAFIQLEVRPFIEGQFKTGRRRVLIGESLAGLFVVHTFLTAPGGFTDFVAVSPSLWWDQRADARSASALLHGRDYRGKRLYVAVGDEGGTMQSGVDMLLAALRKDRPKGLDWRYSDRSRSASHATIYHGAALEAFRWLFAMPAPKPAFDPWFMKENGTPPDSPRK